MRSPKLEAELERTDQMIDRAREVVGKTSSARAILALEQAIKLQQEARHLFKSIDHTNGSSQYNYILKLTLRARDKAKSAISDGSFAQTNDDIVLRKLERINDLLDRLSESLADVNSDNIQAIAQNARENLNRAWELYRSNQFRPALKLANQVENAVQKLINVAEEGIRDRANYELRVSKSEEFLAQARETIADCDNNASLALLERAEEAFVHANEIAARGNYKLALKTIQRIRALLLEAKRSCQSSGDFKGRYEKLVALADRLNDEIPTENTTARESLNQAYTQLGIAERAMKKGDKNSSSIALRAAHLTLERINKSLLRDGI